MNDNVMEHDSFFFDTITHVKGRKGPWGWYITICIAKINYRMPRADPAQERFHHQSGLAEERFWEGYLIVLSKMYSSEDWEPSIQYTDDYYTLSRPQE